MNGNSSSSGGIYTYGTATLVNTIVANSSGGDCTGGTVTANSHNNLIKDASKACALTDDTTGNIVGQNPQLGPLANNGGPTQTHALFVGSLAIDAASAADCPSTDQRGAARPQGASYDIGAYEGEQPNPDRTKPTTNPSQSPAVNSAGWNTSDVTVSWNWSDSGSGIDPNACITSSTPSGEGMITLTASCTDLVGNQGSASFPVKVDKTAPTIAAAATGAPNASGWYNTPVTIYFTCADALSGIPTNGCPADQVLSTEGTTVSSSAQTVTDAAGNPSAASNVVTVKLDTTAPTTSARETQATVSLAASDSLSGVASTRYSVNGGAAQTYSTPFVLNGADSYTISYASVDVASNIEATKTLNVTIAQPTSGVLDSFNRAKGSVGANWEGMTGTGFYRIAANGLDVEAGGPLVWKPTSFGTAQEAFVTLSTIDPKGRRRACC